MHRIKEKLTEKSKPVEKERKTTGDINMAGMDISEDISHVRMRTSPPGPVQMISNSKEGRADGDKKNSASIQIDPEKIDKLSKDLNTYMDDIQTSMGFVLYKALDNQVVIQIKDRKTGDLIRQIPSEELLKIREKMSESTGLIFDERV